MTKSLDEAAEFAAQQALAEIFEDLQLRREVTKINWLMGFTEAEMHDLQETWTGIIANALEWATSQACTHPGCCCVCGHQGKCPEDGPIATGGTFD